MGRLKEVQNIYYSVKVFVSKVYFIFSILLRRKVEKSEIFLTFFLLNLRYIIS